jgi:hypothetical protein
MTDINYNSKEKGLEISVRIFTDDFENVLHKNFKTKMDIANPADNEQMNKYVAGYIQNHLKLVVNGELKIMSFVGYEQQQESIWAYFEVNNITALNTLSIHNSLLHDYNKNQINMLNIRANNTERSTKLNYPNTEYTLSF